MSWSVGEIMSLSTRAARGAGVPDNLAEVAGNSVIWLQRAGLPGIEALAQYLVELEKRGGKHDKTVCPLHRGMKLEVASAKPKSLSSVEHPLLLTPALAPLGETSVRFTIGAVSLIVSPDGVAHTATHDALLVEKAECDYVISGAAVDAEPVTRIDAENGASVAVLQYFASHATSDEPRQPDSATNKNDSGDRKLSA